MTNLPQPSNNPNELKAESNLFYKKLFQFLNLNQALTLGGYSTKYIHEMNEEEYEEYLIRLEYLHRRGVINLDAFNKKGP